jgi:hypothetical protein
VPVVTLSAVAAVWFSFVTYNVHYGYGPYLAYMAWSLPLAGVLGWTLYRSPLRSENPWLAGPTSAARRSSRSTSTT